MLDRLRRYPPSFLLAHPVRAARNLLGNHRSALADRWLAGLRGVEIGGAAHNDFFLDTVNVDYSPEPGTAAAQRRHAGRVLPVDFVARADALPFSDGAHDFVIASHVLEHVPDPIGALREWARVARRHVLLVLPAADNPYDRGRPLTPIAELEERHARGFDSPEDRHWNVWTAAALGELCEHLGLAVLEVCDPDDKRGNGYALVLDASSSSARSARADSSGA